MAIAGLENLSIEQLNQELQRGGKFVVFEYCISVLILSFKRSSKIYFLRADENAFGKSVPYTLLSLVLGWWGIPWGPIWTISTMVTNLSGGRNVTNEVIAVMSRPR